jgi:hypothetical protein
LQSVVDRLALTARARIPDRAIVRGREQREGHVEKQGDEMQGKEGEEDGEVRKMKEKEEENYFCLFLLLN